MRASTHHSHLTAAAVLGCLLAFFAFQESSLSQTARPVVPYLQERLGLNEGQVTSGLGALLVFARERLPKPEFDQLARRMPNADVIMQQTKLRGVVTRPLDDVDDYEAALANLGISEQVASQFAPAVLEYLASAGYSEERDILAGVLD